VLAETKSEFSELREWFPIMQQKQARLRAKLDEEQRHEDEHRAAMIQILHGRKTIAELETEKAKLHAESLVLKAKHDLLRLDERTQRRAKICNRADAISRSLMLIEDAIAQRKKTSRRGE
jgi:hypothetical protein